MNDDPKTSEDNSQQASPLFLSTEQIPRRSRHAWLVEEIGRQYANVEITPPKNTPLFNEMRIYPWGAGKLSVVRSSQIQLHRPEDSHRCFETDAIFFIVLLSGRYYLQQGKNEVYLNPGDISLYNVRQPHLIKCPEHFSKIIIKVPGPVIRTYIPQIDHYSAMKITTKKV